MSHQLSSSQPLIVVLDSLPIDNGDIDWQSLKNLGRVVVHSSTKVSQLNGRLDGCSMAITNKVAFDVATLQANPQLKYIGVTATGYNIVDMQAASNLGITVTNVPSYSTDSVAEVIFAFILEFAKQIGHHQRSVKQGDWVKSSTFSYYQTPLFELRGKKLGIIGYGNIGRRTSELAQAFGMDTLVYTRHPKADSEQLHFVNLDTLLAKSDIVSLCCPLSSETLGLMGSHNLAKMKPGSYLINTGRGTLIDEESVAQCLASGHLAGFGTDVLSSEPPKPDNPLLTATNCFITPHIAWASYEARSRLYAATVANVKAYLEGKPTNVVH
jgi:glycerate dehydrogenase